MHIKHSGQRPLTIRTRPAQTTAQALPQYPGAIAWTPERGASQPSLIPLRVEVRKPARAYIAPVTKPITQA